MGEWSDWEESGDIVGTRNSPGGQSVPQHEVLRRVAGSFRRVVIDWTEGDRWVEARIAAWTRPGTSPIILEAEHALRGQAVQVSVADAPGPDAAWVRFYMTPDTELFELRYGPPGALEACRALAHKLAETLGYEFSRLEDEEPDGPGELPEDLAAREVGLRALRELLDTGACLEKRQAEPGAAADGGA